MALVQTFIARRRAWAWRLDRAGVAALLLLDLAAALGLLASWWWAFEILRHFIVQLAIGQIALMAFLAARRKLWPVAVSLPFLMLSIHPVIPYYLPAHSADAAPAIGDTRLRLMTLNLLGRNDRIDLVEAAVREEDPDVILFVEATPRWHRLLAGIAAAYPYRVGAASDLDRTVLVSRRPLAEARMLRLGPDRSETALARLCPTPAETAGGGCLTLLGAHPERPQSAALARSRNRQLKEMARIAAAAGSERSVIMGDLNITPWSPYFGRLLAAGGLSDSAAGRGVHPTWASRWLPFGLPIDHVLVGSALRVLDRHVGAEVGSDHYPVVVDIAF